MNDVGMLLCYFKTIYTKNVIIFLTFKIWGSYFVFRKLWANMLIWNQLNYMLLLTFDKMAKFKTIKTIVMKRSDVVLKTAIITKILFQLWHGNRLKSNVGILQL